MCIPAGGVGLPFPDTIREQGIIQGANQAELDRALKVNRARAPRSLLDESMR
jgi:hypothetical protein